MANNMPRPTYGKAPHAPTLDELADRARPVTQRPIPGGADTRQPAALGIRNKTSVPPKPKSPFAV